MTFIHPTIKTMRMARRPGPEGSVHHVLVVETEMDMPYSRNKQAGRHDNFRELMIQIARLKSGADPELSQFDAIEVKGPTWSAFANGQGSAPESVSRM